MTNKRRLVLLRVAALFAVVVLSVYIFSVRNQAEKLAVYGYPGIFVLAFMAYATVLLPAPGIAIVFTMGGIFNPFFVALAAGAGAALGELSGYLAGFSGQAVIERANTYERFSGWMRINGPITVLVLAAIPNPFFDLAGVAAGALKMRLPIFLFWAWIGETIKMLVFAYAGSNLIQMIK